MDLTIIIVGIAAMFLVMAGAWLWVRQTHNGGLADIVWTFGLGAVGIFYCLTGKGQSGFQPRQLIAAFLIGLWMVRLGAGLSRRNFNGPEDARYKEFRGKWGDKFMPRLFGLLMVQAVAAILLTLCAMLAAHNPLPLGIVDVIGVLWMLAALGGSFVADRQLAQFKHDPANKGKICDIGLWSRSRHPNYFFETMFWAGWPMLALSGGWGWGLLAFVAPAFIYWLLRYLSGEPMLEELMARNYGQAFADYCRRVPPFFPRLVRK